MACDSFFNALDVVYLNAYIVYKKVTECKLFFGKFLLELINDMCTKKVNLGSVTRQDHHQSDENSARKRRQYQVEACKSKSLNQCAVNVRMCCGAHITS